MRPMAMYKDLTLENWLEEDNIFESLRAIGANFDRDRSAFTVQPRTGESFCV
jgi:hypothetical protein